MNLRDLLDSVIEVPVGSSFTRIGYDVRSRSDHWRRLDSYDLTERTILVTGATSGLGLSACEQFARMGATLVLLGRDAAKTEAAAKKIRALTKPEMVRSVVADMGDLDQVRAAAARVRETVGHLDVLVHNAGALSARRVENRDGIEQTVASQVVGPFLFTQLLLPMLRAHMPARSPVVGLPGRVLTMSSGGMYASKLRVDDLQMSEGSYKGAEQYARAKRAQVTLSEMWAERVPREETVFHALHPGWADTPGVEASLPTFRKIVGPLLRSPEQGADTLVWLAADDGAPLASSGRFWLDRRPRAIHKLPSTKVSDTAQHRAELWEWVEAACSAASVA